MMNLSSCKTEGSKYRELRVLRAILEARLSLRKVISNKFSSSSLGCQGIAPPTLNLEHPDAIFDSHFCPLTAPKTMDIRAVLTNSFGFGGTNAALVFTAPPQS